MPFRITCIIGALTAGGAERNLVWLCEQLAAQGHAVTLMTLMTSEPVFFAPVPAVRLCSAPESTMAPIRFYRIGARRQRWVELRRAIEATAPDLVVSFIDAANVHALRALWRTTIPVIVSERIDLSTHAVEWKVSVMRRLLYPFAKAVVMVAPDNIGLVAKYWPRWRACHIPNPVRPPQVDPAAAKPSWFGGKNVVAMGRLVQQKGFDLLLKAFAAIADRVPAWHLTIIGEGPLRGELAAQAADAGLGERVTFAGLVRHPEELLSAADLFVLSSRFEGFPNALAEAMSCGVPVVSFACGGGGPADIVRPGIDGWLVESIDADSLRDVMLDAMLDDVARRRFARAAREVAGRFTEERVLARWEELISAAVGVKP